MMRALRSLAVAIVVVASALVPRVLWAQTYPSKPVRIVASFAAGGGLDLMARLVARKLTEQWGVPVVVENRPGAGGTIGAAAVAAAPGDGYTILAGGNPEITVMPHLMANLSYDPLRDLTPIVLAAFVPSVLAVGPTADKRTTMADLLAQARKDSVAVATPGKGTPMHIAIEMLNAQAGTHFVNTPYKGGGPAAQDLVAGQIAAAIVNLPPLRPHIASGRVRALVVMQAERSPQLPDVPTLKEASGIDNVSAPAWFAFLAPSSVPPGIVSRLEGSIREALADRVVVEQLTGAGMDVVRLPGDRFASILRAESEQNAGAIKRFRITGE